MTDDVQHLHDHMVHALGRINHLELQVKALAAAVAKLQAQVAQAQQREQRFADGSRLIESPQGFTIIDEPAPYNRENKGDLGQK